MRKYIHTRDKVCRGTRLNQWKNSTASAFPCMATAEWISWWVNVWFEAEDKHFRYFFIPKMALFWGSLILLPGKSHGWRSLEGCSPWGRWGSGTTERLPFHFSLACIGEENGNPLQCSCLENPRDVGAWWAAIYGVAQSRTRLKWLSSSSRETRGLPTNFLYQLS